jgi:membrane protease YdiL (CAAX protease family)
VEPPVDRRTLLEEVLVVLLLSLLASAVYSVLDLLATPQIAGTYVATVDSSTQLARQLANIFVLGLAPVYLVLHLVRRSGEGIEGIGLATDRPRFDILSGVALFAIVGAGGIAVYLISVHLGVNSYVVPVPPLHHWWTVPVLFLSAAQAALLEEILVVGYLVTRLRQLSFSPLAAVAASALLRGSYHLYQGWGGFAGNLVMGALFAALFVKWRRAWPFVIAHMSLDVVAGVGFILFRHHLPGFA